MSLDPDRDTPELLRDVIKTHGVDAERWTLGRTPEASVREIAAVLGIRYRALADGEMNHSSILTLLDANGRVVKTSEARTQVSEIRNLPRGLVFLDVSYTRVQTLRNLPASLRAIDARGLKLTMIPRDVCVASHDIELLRTHRAFASVRACRGR